MGRGGNVWAGKGLEGGYSRVCCYTTIDGANQRWMLASVYQVGEGQRPGEVHNRRRRRRRGHVSRLRGAARIEVLACVRAQLRASAARHGWEHRRVLTATSSGS